MRITTRKTTTTPPPHRYDAATYQWSQGHKEEGLLILKEGTAIHPGNVTLHLVLVDHYESSKELEVSAPSFSLLLLLLFSKSSSDLPATPLAGCSSGL